MARPKNTYSEVNYQKLIKLSAKKEDVTVKKPDTVNIPKHS